VRARPLIAAVPLTVPVAAKQRRKDRAALLGQGEAPRGQPLDQAADHDLLRGRVRHAGAVPIGSGGEAEQEHPFGHRAPLSSGSCLQEPAARLNRAARLSPRISHTTGSADAVAPAAVGVADGELVVGIGVETDVGPHPDAQATAQLQARGLLQ
jgi:hypothetical protein